MNSISSQKQVTWSTKNKAKAMAIKYEKYLKKKSSQSASKKLIFAQKWVQKTNQILVKAWNAIIPTFVRGYSTPYQSFIHNVPKSLKNQLQNLPLCQLTLSQAIQLSKVNLIVTYNQRSIENTIQSLNNNQQINSLINKKAQIIPVKISSSSKNQVSVKLKEIIDQLGSNFSDQNQVFVVWKGLYQEILVIDRFQLNDPDLCMRAIRAVQQRQDYEEMIRKLANQTDLANEQSSLNQLSQQSTGIPKQGVD